MNKKKIDKIKQKKETYRQIMKKVKEAHKNHINFWKIKEFKDR